MFRTTRNGFGLYTESVTDWDAARYDRVSNPQLEWGRRVIARLAPAPGERGLDPGCGTGRLTAEIAVAVPDGLVVGLDPSAAMLDVVCEAAPRRLLPWVREDSGWDEEPDRRCRFPAHSTLCSATRRSTGSPITIWYFAAFMGAATGWSVRGAVRRRSKPGAPLLARRFADAPSVFGALLRRMARPMAFRAARRHDPALRPAGFDVIDASLKEAPVTFSDPALYPEFIECVCVRHHLERLPAALHVEFLTELTRAAGSDDPPFTLDYWRLNIQARRPPA